ncbi:MAG TPA: hypothetical protein VF174_15140 [Micromonosporaceae bacterium]
MLVFVGLPAAIVLIITALAMAGGGRSPARYRPGRPFDFTPVWFLSSPDQVAGSPSRAGLHVEGRPERAELTKGEVEIKAAPVRPGSTGGASDRW